MHEQADTSLDPDNWGELREQGHRMLDDMFDYLQGIRARPVWQPIPAEVRAHFTAPMPAAPQPISQVHREFMDDILPYAVGNAHPGFFGWVHGGGTAAGMLAEMLAAGLNANVGGRDQIPVEVERQVVRWMRDLFQFPEGASGLFVTGTSMANMIGLLVARTRAIGPDIRAQGLAAANKRLVAYTSAAAHGCIAQAMDLAGFGTDALRIVPVDRASQMDLAALEAAIVADREAGRQPFFVAGTAGTVDTGAVDDLAQLAGIAERHRLWFHVDGAYGALAMLSPELAPILAGIERADSVAFDFHKWGQVPYDAGFVLVRDGELHRRTFAADAPYLQREQRAMAAGSPWPCDFGPDLSRSFRALKTWFTIKTYGSARIGEVIAETCRLAAYLAERVKAEPALELMAPVRLNIVCLRYRCLDANRVNADLVADIQESGVAAPSTTMLDGRLAIRVAIVNHRTGRQDVDRLLDAILSRGARATAIE
jgi:aromatic-L-amino-acid decarboxylase